MARLTWQNVDAPDFSPAMRGFELASRQLSEGLNRAREGLTEFDDSLTERTSKQAMLDAMAFQDPEAFKQAMASGEFMANRNINRLNPAALGVIANRTNALAQQERGLVDLKDAQGDLAHEQSEREYIQGRRDRLKAATPTLTRLLNAYATKDTETINAIQADPEQAALIAALDYDQFTDFAKTRGDIARDELNLRQGEQSYSQSATRFEWEGTDRQEERDTALLVGLLSRFSDREIGAQNYLYSNYDSLTEQYGGQVVAAAARRLGLDGWTERGFTGGGVGGGAVGGGGGSINVEAIQASPDDASALVTASQQFGLDPLDVATIISYETKGKFDPNIRGGKNNEHVGLIQFSDENQIKYGIKPGMSIKDQVPAVMQYLRDRGARPGDDITTLYRIINGGNRNAPLSASDGNGTIGSHVQKMLAEHRGNASRFLGSAQNPRAASTAVTTALATAVSGDPVTEFTRNFQSLHGSTEDTGSVANKLAQLPNFKGQKPEVLADNITYIREKYKVNAAVAGAMLQQAYTGSEGAWGKIKDNFFLGDGLSLGVNEQLLDKLGGLVKNPDGLIQSSLALQAQTDAAGQVNQANAAVDALTQEYTTRERAARRSGRIFNGAAILNEIAEATGQRDAALDNAGQIAVASLGDRAKGNKPSAPAPKQAAARPQSRNQHNPIALLGHSRAEEILNRAKGILRTGGVLRERQEAAFKKEFGVLPAKAEEILIERGRRRIKPTPADKIDAAAALAQGNRGIQEFMRSHHGVHPSYYMK